MADFRIDFAAIAALIGALHPAIMSANPSESPIPLAEITHGPSKFEAFLDRNQKLLVVVAILIALGTAGFVVYRGIEKSRQETAGAELLAARDMDDLRAVINNHEGTQAAKSASVLLAEAQWSSGQQEDSIATLEAFLAKEPKHPAAPTAKASLAAKWMVQGKNAEAVTLFEELADDPAARHLAPYALICLGDIAMNAADASRAEEAYSRAASEFSTSDYARVASSRLQDLKAKAPVAVAPPAPKEAPGDDIPDSIRAPEEPVEGDSATGALEQSEGALTGALIGAAAGALIGGEESQTPPEENPSNEE